MDPVIGLSLGRIVVGATVVLGIQYESVSTRTGAMLVGPAVGAVLSGFAGLRGRR